MAMLPIFIIGFGVGMLVNMFYNMYKKETPSSTRLHMLEKELEREKKDKLMLNELVDKLYIKIDELEKKSK